MKKILTKTDLSNLTNENDNLLVIRFHAPWCQPCKMLGEIIENLGNIDGVEFADIDIDEAEDEVINEFNVRNVPLLIFMKDGLNVDRSVGLISREALLNKIEENKNK